MGIDDDPDGVADIFRHPSRVRSEPFIIRWYRYAQPPANFFEPSGFLGYAGLVRMEYKDISGKRTKKVGRYFLVTCQPEVRSWKQREKYTGMWDMGFLPMYLFGLFAIAVCAWGFYRRIRVYRLGRPLDRSDRLPLRITLMLRRMLTQSKVLREPGSGALHAFFFWGFGLLFIGTLLIMVQADLTAPLFHLRFLTGGFYKLFSLLLDIAGGVAIIMLGGLLARRFFIRPAALQTVRDDYLIHALLFSILITGFLVEGTRMASTEIGIDPGLARFSPIGLGVGRLFMVLSPARLSLVHRILWWLHFFLAMGFIALLPFTKLRHIFTIPANYLFTDLGPRGAIASIDLEDESITQYGAARVTDLTWKDILDTDACTNCGRCQDQCPAWNTDKPLSPMKVIRQIGEAAFGNSDDVLAAKIGEDVIWSCTTCGACREVCPADIEHVNKIIEMRRNLALMEGAFPDNAVRTAFENLEANANPFGLAHAGRGDWAEGLEISIMASDADVEILYFAGCYASFDRRNREVARSFVKICNAAGVKVGILGKEEKCCGEPPRKLGNEYLYQMTAQAEHRADQGLRREKDRHHLPPLFQHPGAGLPGPRPGYPGRALHDLHCRSLVRGAVKAGTDAVRLHLPRLMLPGTLYGHNLCRHAR